MPFILNTFIFVVPLCNWCERIWRMSKYLGKCNTQRFQLYSICLTAEMLCRLGYYATFEYITCIPTAQQDLPLLENPIFIFYKDRKVISSWIKNIYNVSIFTVRVVECCCWYLTFDSLSIWPPTLFMELSFCEVAAPTCRLEISCIIFFVIFPMMAFISEAY